MCCCPAPQSLVLRPSVAVTDDIGEQQWRRISASVRPLRRNRILAKPVPLPPPVEVVAAVEPKRKAVKGRVPAPLVPKAVAKAPPARPVFGGEALDGTWERQLRGGRLQPDMTIDLHGHSLASAHVQLARALDQASAVGARVLLVVAGKVRGPDEAPRGAIRRELASWLSHSSHASRIMAVRNAHPRHGGAGAVYILLKKPR